MAFEGIYASYAFWQNTWTITLPKNYDAVIISGSAWNDNNNLYFNISNVLPTYINNEDHSHTHSDGVTYREIGRTCYLPKSKATQGTRITIDGRWGVYFCVFGIIVS